MLDLREMCSTYGPSLPMGRQLRRSLQPQIFLEFSGTCHDWVFYRSHRHDLLVQTGWLQDFRKEKFALYNRNDGVSCPHSIAWWPLFPSLIPDILQ